MSQNRNLGWLLCLVAPAFIAWGLILIPGSRLSWLHACTLGMVFVCGVSDQRWGRIPNYATYSGAGWGLFINCWPALATWLVLGSQSSRLIVGDVGWNSSLFGLLLCFVIMLIGYLIAGSGAGDVKLAAALGALLGWRIALQCLMASFIIAGAAMTIWFVWTMGPRLVVRAVISEFLRFIAPSRVPRGEEELKLLKAPVPLGIFFTLGTAFVLFVSE